MSSESNSNQVSEYAVEDVQQVMSRGQLQEIEFARRGDKEAFSRLYQIAAAFLEARGTMPPELAAFMAERLQAIGKALSGQDTRKVLPEAVAPGLKRGRPAKRGDMLVVVAEAVNDLAYGGRSKKRLTIELAEAYGFKPESVKAATHAVKRGRK